MGVPRPGRRADPTHPAGSLPGIQRGGGLGTRRGQVPPRRRSPPFSLVYPSPRSLFGTRGRGFRRSLPGRPLSAVHPRRDRPTPRGVSRFMAGLETPQGTDRAVRLSPTLPDPVPLLAAPQAAVPSVNPGGTPPPEVPQCQAAMALGGVPPSQGRPPLGPTQG